MAAKSIEELRNSFTARFEELDRKILAQSESFDRKILAQGESLQQMMTAFFEKVEHKLETSAPPTVSGTAAMGDDLLPTPRKEEAIIEQDVGSSENEALKMFDRSTEPIFTGLKSFSGTFDSISTIEEVEFSSLKARIQLMEEVDELFPSKQKDVKTANQLFDEMPKPSSMKIECLSNGCRLFDEMSDLSLVKHNDKIKGREEVVLQAVESSMVLGYEEDASETSKFIFDPGGSTLHHVGCNAFECNKYSVLGCDFIDSNGVKQDSIVKLGVGKVLLFIFDPGGSEPFESTGVTQNLSKSSENHYPAAWILEITSPAEKIRLGLDLAEIYHRSALFKQNKELVDRLSQTTNASKELSFQRKYSKTFITQCLACLYKQLVSLWRNPQYTAVRFFYTVIISLMFGGTFWKFGSRREVQKELFNAMGCMYSAVLYIGVTNAMSVQPVVAMERSIAYIERAAGMYSAVAFASVQVAIEVPYVLVQTCI